MPLYHAAGMYMSLLMTHYWDNTTVLGIGNRPLSSDMALECIKHSPADAVALPPAIYEELSQDPEAIAVLKKLSWVSFGGGKITKFYERRSLRLLIRPGNLAREAGDRLVKGGVRLVNFIGATE